MKSEYSAKLEKLEVKLSAVKNDEADIKGSLDRGIDNLFKIDAVYTITDPEKKKK